MGIEPRTLIEPALTIARAAGREILDIYESGFSVEFKADRSPVTAADRAAHALIARELVKLTPGVPVWSEESATQPFAERASWSSFWLVDPLDGTKEFIKRNGEFTVNIALVCDGEPVLGVVHAPATDRDYFGCRGGGAFRRQSSSSPQSIAVSRPAFDPVRVVGSRSHGGETLQKFLRRLGRHTLLSMGSSLKFCLVAEGSADLYPRLGPTSEWDTAAAQAIVEAAGGAVVDFEGRPLRYNRREGVLNPHFLVFGDPSRNWLSLLK